MDGLVEYNIVLKKSLELPISWHTQLLFRSYKLCTWLNGTEMKAEVRLTRREENEKIQRKQEKAASHIRDQNPIDWEG
jgi:hypothetical protein